MNKFLNPFYKACKYSKYSSYNCYFLFCIDTEKQVSLSVSAARVIIHCPLSCKTSLVRESLFHK